MSRKKNTRQSTIMQEYRAERRKAQRRISGLEERGYYFEKPILKEPPKRITKQSIEALKKTTQLETLYSKAKYYTNEGEITGTQARHLERQIAARKGAETRRVKQQEYVRYADDYNFELDRIEFKYNEAKKKAVEEYNKNLSDIRNNKYLNKYERYNLYNEESTRYQEALEEIEQEREEKIIKIPERIEQKRKDEERLERIRREQALREARELASFDDYKRDKIQEYMNELNIPYEEARDRFESMYEYDRYDESDYDTYEPDDIEREISKISPDEIEEYRTQWAEEQGVSVGTQTADETWTVLDTAQQLIDQWTLPETLTRDQQYNMIARRTTLQSILDDAINEYGEKAVAQRLENSAEAVGEIVDKLLYKAYDQNWNSELARFASIIKGSALSVQESKDITDMQERNYDEMLNG